MKEIVADTFPFVESLMNFVSDFLLSRYPAKYFTFEAEHDGSTALLHGCWKWKKNSPGSKLVHAAQIIMQDCQKAEQFSIEKV